VRLGKHLLPMGCNHHQRSSLPLHPFPKTQSQKHPPPRPLPQMKVNSREALMPLAVLLWSVGMTHKLHLHLHLQSNYPPSLVLGG
jgi:hypothetical protein